MSEGLQGWFAGRLPDAWGTPEIEVDRDEVTVVVTLDPPAVEGDPADVAAAEAGRISRWREETRDERGLSHRYEGAGTGGISLTVADTPILSSTTTDTFTADVGPDNTATGETKSERNESSLLSSLFSPVAGPAAALLAPGSSPPPYGP